MGPRVRTVESHIDRDVTDDAHAALPGIIMDFFPLLHELELLEAVKIDLIRNHFGCDIHGFFVADAVGFFPFNPRLAFIFILEGHEQAVILEPV